ncbi:MAG: arylesterase [Thermodesulfobacteriota bacterium]
MVRRIIVAVCWVCCCLLFAGACRPEAETPDRESRAGNAPVPGRKTIVALGDSLTYGDGVAAGDAYPAVLAERLRKEGREFQVINAGVKGEASSGTLFRTPNLIKTLHPDILILCTGANDGLRNIKPAVLRTNLDRILTMLRQSHVRVILVGMQAFFPARPDYRQEFDAVYPEIAQKHGVIFVPFLLEGIAGDPELMQEDELHPNADGYGKVVDILYPHVIQAIEEAVEKHPKAE